MSKPFTLFIIACLASSPRAWAVEPLDDLTVIATRLQESVSDLPHHVTIISAEDIASLPNKTLPEILNLKAGLLIRSSFGNNAARTVVDIRGFGATGTQNTLVLLDGKRLNDIDQSTINYAAIPLNNIERIEVIRGSGGVLYGDGAVGGVINIVTRRSRGDAESITLQQRFASYDTFQTDGNLRFGRGRFAVNLFANTLNSQGYRDNNELDQQNLQADVRYEFDHAEIFGKFGYSDQQLGLPGNRTVDSGAGLNELEADRRGTNNPDDDASEDQWFVTTGLRGQWFGNSEYIIDLGVRDKQQVSDFISQPRYIETDLQTLFFTPRFIQRFNTGSLSHSLQTGVDLYFYQYDSTIANSAAELVTPVRTLDIDQQSYSIYANDELRLDSKTVMTLGGRYTYVQIDAKDDFNPAAPGSAFDAQAPAVDRSDNESQFTLGLRRQYIDAISAYVNWGQSVRLANIDDINQLSFPAPTFNAVREFTNLQPQRARHFDVGLDYKRNNIALSANLYHIKLKNEIQFNPVTFSNVNLDPTKRQGVEMSLDWQPNSRLHTRLNYNLIRSKFNSGTFAGSDVPLVPKETLQFVADYQFNSQTQAVFSWSYVGDKFFDNDQSNTFGQKIPSYSLVDVGISHVWQGFEASFSVNNLLDKQAFDAGVSSAFTPGRYNALPLPERNFAVVLRYTF